jgi:hypothetical protein
LKVVLHVRNDDGQQNPGGVAESRASKHDSLRQMRKDNCIASSAAMFEYWQARRVVKSRIHFVVHELNRAAMILYPQNTR